MVTRHGGESGASSATGRASPSSTTVKSPACTARGTSPFASRICTASSIDAGVGGGAPGTGLCAARRAVRRRTGASITALFYGLGRRSRRNLLRPQIRHQRQQLLEEGPQQRKLEQRDQSQDQLHRALHQAV